MKDLRPCATRRVPQRLDKGVMAALYRVSWSVWNSGEARRSALPPSVARSDPPGSCLG